MARGSFIDLTGQTFGRWRVLSRAANRGTNPTWRCACECGTEREVFGSQLRSGGSRSCGCLHRETTVARQSVDLAGRRFGRLTAVARDRSRNGSYWTCACDCGAETSVRSDGLTGGRSQSCGCLRLDRFLAATVIDRTGERHGNLTVLKASGPGRGGDTAWACRCDCGNTVEKLGRNLVRGTRSCGCHSASHVRNERHALYRLYSDIGELLYVGLTVDVKTRMKDHRNGKAWWPEVAYRRIEWHPDRLSADAAETAAIRTEHPTYNIAKVEAVA